MCQDKAALAKKMRAEKRRNHLLENALKEARERRFRERSTLDSDAVKPAPAYWSNAKAQRYEATAATADDVNASVYSYSNESKTSLLDDDRKTDSPDDPTVMSISDILRVKQMMKEKKKRVRKILMSDK